MKKFVNLLQYLAVRGVMAAAGALPRKFSRGIAKVLATFGARIPGFGLLVAKNLRAAFPEKSEKEIRRMTRESLASLITTLFEFFWIQRNREKFDGLYTCTPECQRIGEALAKDHTRPHILITPHFGNWEISGMILARHFGMRMATVVRTPRNPYLDRIVSEGRMVPGVEIVHSKRGMLRLLSLMQEGAAAGLLIDQNTRLRDGGVFVDFFGLPCPVSKSPATLARKLHATVAVGCSIRDGNGHFTAFLKELPKDASEYADDGELVRDVMRLSEEFIRLAPEQYLWMYKRFQHIPPDASAELRKRYPDYASVPPPSFFDARNKYHADLR